MCLRDLNHANTLAKGNVNFESLFYVFKQSFCLMGHVALRPSFLFIKSPWVKLLSLLLFVVSNHIALDTHCDVVSSLIKILNFQTSVCYVSSFKLTSEWVNLNLTSLVDLNKRLIDELVLVHLITREREKMMMRRKKKENDEFCGYHSMREVEMMKMMTTEGMTRNSLQA
jgi:hypothetical protein